MPVTFQLQNATGHNLPLLNWLPAAGWGPLPPNMLPAAAGLPAQAVFNNPAVPITISYGVAGNAHNAVWLPASAVNPPTVNTTPNIVANIAAAGAGNFVVTLTFF
ncbi:MAG: hypothetical protein AB1489_11560 [Acidobacteriota bacterium]